MSRPRGVGRLLRRGGLRRDLRRADDDHRLDRHLLRQVRSVSGLLDKLGVTIETLQARRARRRREPVPPVHRRGARGAARHSSATCTAASSARSPRAASCRSERGRRGRPRPRLHRRAGRGRSSWSTSSAGSATRSTRRSAAWASNPRRCVDVRELPKQSKSVIERLGHLLSARAQPALPLDELPMVKRSARPAGVAARRSGHAASAAAVRRQICPLKEPRAPGRARRIRGFGRACWPAYCKKSSAGWKRRSRTRRSG